MKCFLWTGWLGLLLLMVVDHPGHSATISVGEGLQYSTLSSAILDATAGDVLLVSPGVYDSTRGETFPLTPKAAITIRASSPEVRPLVQSDPFETAFVFEGIGPATLDGFEITGGGTNGFDIRSSTVSILNSEIFNQGHPTAYESIRVVDSALTLEGVDLSYFLGRQSAKAISCNRSTLTLDGCIVTTFSSGFVVTGVALDSDRCPHIVLRNSIMRNHGGPVGAIVHLRNPSEPQGNLLIEDCTLTENSATTAILQIENYNSDIRRLNVYENMGGSSADPRFALNAVGGVIRLSDSNISNNVGIGGAFVESGTLVVENCTVIDNGQDGVGAEYFYLQDSLVSANGQTGVKANHFQIQDATISNNGYAGLVHLTDPLTSEEPSAATDTTISGNGAQLSEYSGPLDIQAAGVNVRRDSQFKRCHILNNRKETRNGSAGIYSVGDLLLEDCIIAGNSSADGNAALFCVRGDAVVSRCQILGNAIDPNPPIFNNGAIHCGGGGRIFFINSIIAGNTMRNWPLISASAASGQRENGLFFFNCTIEGNHRSIEDIPFIWAPGESFLTLVNTIVWNGEDNLSSDNLVVSHSNTDDQVYPGPGNISEDPLFFQPWDGASADYRLPCNSPSVDSGTSEGAPSVDITGSHRPRGAGVDMGAYENCVLDFNGDGMENGEDLLFFPTEWYEEVTVDNQAFDFVTGPSTPNRIDSADLLKTLE